jgi:hypothetical protein
MARKLTTLALAALTAFAVALVTGILPVAVVAGVAVVAARGGMDS